MTKPVMNRGSVDAGLASCHSDAMPLGKGGSDPGLGDKFAFEIGVESDEL